MTSHEIAERIEHYESLVEQQRTSKDAIFEFALSLNTLFEAERRIVFIERVWPGIGRWVRTDFYITIK